MARTAEMRLIELMVLKQDISSVIEYIGKKESFQFQDSERDKPKDKKSDSELDIDSNFYNSLRNASVNLGIPLDDASFNAKDCTSPTAQDREEAARIIKAYNDIQEELEAKNAEVIKCTDAYKEALAFANLKVSFSELDSLSFLTLRVGKIDASGFDNIKSALAVMAVVIALGEDKSHVLVASSKKNSAQVDVELKKLGFVPLEIPKDFQGVPQDVLDGLLQQKKKV